ncbi:MAG: clostripain-related cysteine peptidase [Elusimicrobiales bacterium]|nr:clostripain-related cysteine peptidase [Elusimicrobiales bacterium]
MKTALIISLSLLVQAAPVCAEDFSPAAILSVLQESRELKPASAAPAIQAVPVDFQADASAAEAEKEWTVMVFINGKNDLEPFSLRDINEMEMVGSNRGLNIVVEVGYQSNNNMYRYLVSRDTEPARIGSRLLGSAFAIDMGDPAAVKDFVLWAERRFPARKYMLILWDHGSGWLKGNPVESSAKGISDDFVTGHNISTPQLGRLLRDIEAGGARVDLLAFDACLMQMAEVAYELKDSRVEYIAGSEEIEPGDGYPYDKWLAPLAANPGMGSRQLGVLVAREYLKAYPNGFQRSGMTYSLLETARVPELAVKMNALALAAVNANDKAAVLRARNEATRYSLPDNKDLRRFAQLLARHSRDAGVKTAAEDLERFLRRGLGPVVFNGVSANKGTYSYGVAAYIPQSAAEIRGYDELKMSADTQWDEFVRWLLQP